MAKDSEPSPNGGSRPVPDPTVLTDALVERAVAAQRDWTEGKLETLRERLAGMDTATALLPGVVEDKVKCLGDVLEQKFVNVGNEFRALTERMAEQKTDTKDAVDAAFQAAKHSVNLQTEASEKSIAKSEASTTKQIDALGTQTQTAITGLADQITDLKLGIERITAAKIGGVDQRSEIRDRNDDNRANITLAVSAVLFILTLAGLAITLAKGG